VFGWRPKSRSEPEPRPDPDPDPPLDPPPKLSSSKLPIWCSGAKKKIEGKNEPDEDEIITKLGGEGGKWKARREWYGKNA